jgi:hypothetical protein
MESPTTVTTSPSINDAGSARPRGEIQVPTILTSAAVFVTPAMNVTTPRFRHTVCSSAEVNTELSAILQVPTSSLGVDGTGTTGAVSSVSLHATRIRSVSALRPVNRCPNDGNLNMAPSRVSEFATSRPGSRRTRKSIDRHVSACPGHRLRFTAVPY